jgi:serine protease Do
VVAIGNPFQLNGTATAGIVSAKGRDIGEQYVDYLQIDAPINRGNSGGPTFDLNGRVIGVNTAIYSTSGSSAGVGFAIPADTADQVTRQLISGGRITRGYIGVALAPNFDKDAAESLGLGTSKGALIADVTAGGPSARAGLRSGDVVLRVNGQPIENSSELTRRVASVRPGETVRPGHLAGRAQPDRQHRRHHPSERAGTARLQ